MNFVNKKKNIFSSLKVFLKIIFFTFSVGIIFFGFGERVMAVPVQPSGTQSEVIAAPEFNLYNPLTQAQTTKSTVEIIGRAIRFVFGIVGALALLMFILGGTMWLISGGNETRIKKGRDIMVYALLGLLLAFSSYIILNYVLARLLGARGTPSISTSTGTSDPSIIVCGTATCDAATQECYCPRGESPTNPSSLCSCLAK